MFFIRLRINYTKISILNNKNKYIGAGIADVNFLLQIRLESNLQSELKFTCSFVADVKVICQIKHSRKRADTLAGVWHHETARITSRLQSRWAMKPQALCS